MEQGEVQAVPEADEGRFFPGSRVAWCLPVVREIHVNNRA